MNRFAIYLSRTLLALAVMTILGAQCGPTPAPTPLPPSPTSVPPTATPTRVPPTATPTVRPTHTLTPETSVIRVKAPKAALDLWNKWGGKYVLYAHKQAGIKEFRDLNGKDLFVALINVDFDTVMGDATTLLNAGGVKMNLALQNNEALYGSQLLESSNRVGFMVPAVASYYKFEKDKNLVRIELE